MGEVVALRVESQKDVARPMPDVLSIEEIEPLLRWAMRSGYTVEQVRYAVDSVRCWAQSRDKPPRKRSWPLTIEGAMRAGWALKGFKQWSESQSHQVNPRTGLVMVKRTPITEEYIDRYRARLERLMKGDA